MKKFVYGVISIAISSTAFAGGLGKAVVGGVVGGAVAGVVVNSMSGKQAPANSTAQTSNTLLTSEHHTITCVTETGYDCDAFYARSGTRNLSPTQFAGKAGYKALWKVSTLITTDKMFLVLKVSK